LQKTDGEEVLLLQARRRRTHTGLLFRLNRMDVVILASRRSIATVCAQQKWFAREPQGK
jgi:hypothetical protein